MIKKPRVFIGSSSEGLPIAEAVFSSLEKDTEPTLWTHQIFLPGQYPLEVLEKQLSNHSFAVLVASPDDQIIKRGLSSPAMRDNLLVEFGLFTGALGRRRTFFVCPSQPQMELPSDLLGIINATYDAKRIANKPSEISSAVQSACSQIRLVIQEEWESILEELENKSSELRLSEKGQAIQRLHSVVLQLRDAVIAVQQDAIGVFSDENAFEEVKQKATSKIDDIANSFSNDATIIGIEAELENLRNITKEALLELPFPRELAVSRTDADRQALDLGVDALSRFIRGDDPLHKVRQVASNEAQSRISALKQRYSVWWNKYSPRLQRATIEMQDTLFSASIELATEHR